MTTTRMMVQMQGRHPSTQHFEPMFAYGHLPARLAEVSELLHDVVVDILTRLPEDGPELIVGLRKLLEAKDAFVRHAVLTDKE